MIQVLVIGGGVAGLAAAGQAKNMGAIVRSDFHGVVSCLARSAG